MDYNASVLNVISKPNLKALVCFNRLMWELSCSLICILNYTDTKIKLKLMLILVLKLSMRSQLNHYAIFCTYYGSAQHYWILFRIIILENRTFCFQNVFYRGEIFQNMPDKFKENESLLSIDLQYLEIWKFELGNLNDHHLYCFCKAHVKICTMEIIKHVIKYSVIQWVNCSL